MRPGHFHQIAIAILAAIAASAPTAFAQSTTETALLIDELFGAGRSCGDKEFLRKQSNYESMRSQHDKLIGLLSIAEASARTAQGKFILSADAISYKEVVRADEELAHTKARLESTQIVQRVAIECMADELDKAQAKQRGRYTGYWICRTPDDMILMTGDFTFVLEDGGTVVGSLRRRDDTSVPVWGKWHEPNAAIEATGFAYTGPIAIIGEAHQPPDKPGGAHEGFGEIYNTKTRGAAKTCDGGWLRTGGG